MNHTQTNLENLNQKELLHSTLIAAKKEQSATLEVMTHLFEVNKRRLYAELGYSSLWEYSVKELGYSSSSASERCETMRLIYSSTLAKQKVENGELNLTNALKIQRFIRKQKINHKKVLAAPEKEALIQSLCGKSTREVDKILIKLDPTLVPTRETIKPLTEEFTSLHFAVDQETIKLLERMKELKGNHTPLKEIFKLTLKSYLDKNDPYIKAQRQLIQNQHKQVQNGQIINKNNPSQETQTKTARAVELQHALKSTRSPKTKKQSRYKAKNVENNIILRAESQCEHLTPTNKRCSSRTRLEFDHIIPYAMGGENTEKNLRLVCPTHNKLYAIKIYGKEKMERYLMS